MSIPTDPPGSAGLIEGIMTTTAITGNTYPVKDQIKALGGRWDADKKAWMVPADRAEQARRLVASAPKGYVASSSRPQRRRRNEDDECEMCGRNKYTCGHCIGW